MRMQVKISYPLMAMALAVVAAVAPSRASAQIPVPPAAAAPAPAASPTASPPAPTASPLAPAAAGAGPTVDLPPERDMPATALPRETAIENALGSEPGVSGTAVGGYGELTLNVPGNSDPAIVDLRRFVLYVGHNFSDHLRFYSEVEVEHAVSSAGDQGEIEVEQAYLDGLLHRHFNLRAGLILIGTSSTTVRPNPSMP